MAKLKRIECDPDGTVTTVEYWDEVSLPLQRCVVMGDDYFWNGLPAPRDAFGRCKECNVHLEQGFHTGTCSQSMMNTGELR